jgi:GMP synthase-like glutamine amidotransferase
MILLIDLCYKKNSLSRDEFVLPIARIVRDGGREMRAEHYTDITPGDLKDAAAVILCGTALRDNHFLRHLDQFGWMRDCDPPILGICAGMQVIAHIFGGDTEENLAIGMAEVRKVKGDPLFSGIDRFAAYELHRYAAVPPDEFTVIAVSENCVQAIRHPERPIYGVMFHPEVRNEWVVRRFAERYGSDPAA